MSVSWRQSDPDWFEHFISAVEKVGGENVIQDGIPLQAARRIAQDQTYGRIALLPQVNAAEILERARQDKERLAAESLAKGRLQGAEDYRKLLLQEQEKRADELSKLIVRGLEVFVLFVFLLATTAAAASVVFDVGAYLPDWLWVSIAAAAGLGSVISILNMFRHMSLDVPTLFAYLWGALGDGQAHPHRRSRTPSSLTIQPLEGVGVAPV